MGDGDSNGTRAQESARMIGRFQGTSLRGRETELDLERALKAKCTTLRDEIAEKTAQLRHTRHNLRELTRRRKANGREK